MLSVWWDFKYVMFFEFLPRNQTINSNVYCQQLDRLNESKNVQNSLIAKELSSRQRETTHFDDPSKIIEAWMGCVATPTILA